MAAVEDQYGHVSTQYLAATAINIQIGSMIGAIVTLIALATRNVWVLLGLIIVFFFVIVALVRYHQVGKRRVCNNR